MKILTLIALLGTVFLYFQCGNDAPIKTTKTLTEEQPSRLDTVKYLASGKEIANATFKALSSQLQQAIANGGIEHALQFCNVNALPLTDSLSKLYDVSIKRSSHKVRNPKNAPTSEESIVIDRFLAGTSTPIVQLNGAGEPTFYAPIVTKGLCLICHGEVEKIISVADYNTIIALYPNDQAINFKEGELRGMWSITFKNKDHE